MWHGKNDHAHAEKTRRLAEQLQTLAVSAEKKSDDWFDVQVAESFGTLPIEQRFNVVPDALMEREFDCVVVDVSESAPDDSDFGPFRVDKETLVVNASLMGTHMRPMNAPIIIVMDLPVDESPCLEKL